MLLLQLLCEQVVGRGLRRRSYAVNEQGMFEPEYANVYGIPFQFISSDKPIKDPPPKPVIEVCAVEGREELRIEFPKLDGYRIELPDDEILLDLDDAPEFEIGPNTVPSWVEMGGVVWCTARPMRPGAEGCSPAASGGTTRGFRPLRALLRWRRWPRGQRRRPACRGP